MTTYDEVKNNKKLFKMLTSLTPEEFEMLLPFFEAAYDAYVGQIIEQTERERAYGGGRKPTPDGIENMLLFILFYHKVYPLQEVIAFMFGMSQSQASQACNGSENDFGHAESSAGGIPTKEKFDDLVMEIACGLHNFRTECR